MKIAKLLVLSALWLMASSAMAAIVDGVRQKPVPAQTQGFVASESTDTYFYLYNVDAKAFFTEGNAWGTQVSIGDEGLKVAFTPDGTYDLAYLFNDYSNAKKAWKLVFFDSETSMFVDLGSQANYRWGVEQNGETFRLYAASEENGNPGWAATTNEETGEVTEHPAYRQGQYMGYDATSSGTVCAPYLTEGEGHCINWALVTEEVYDVYKTEVTVYAAAEKLRSAIEEAEAKGFTATADYKAVYANEAATVEEIEKATSDLNAAFIEWGSNNASVENPTDLTTKIVNPNFDNADVTTGWSGDAFGRGGTVADGAEHYSKNYDTYQTITGLTPGVYAIGVKAFYRAGNYGGDAESHYVANDEASKYAKLYAKVGDNIYETPIANVMSGAQAEAQDQGDIDVTYQDAEGNEVTVYVPNTMATGDYFFHTLNQYANKLFVAVGEAGELTIGVKKTTQIGGDWSLFDDFSLTYYGTAGEAYQLFFDENLKNYSNVTLDENTMYTEQYLTAYQESLEGEHKVSTQAEVDAALEAIVGSYDALQKNIQLWKDYEAQSLRAQGMLTNNDLDWDRIDDAYALSDWADMDSKEIIEDRNFVMTNEELEAEITKWTAIIDEVKSWFKPVEVETDMTQLLTNPDYEGGENVPGWTIEKASGGNVALGGTSTNKCYEAWNNEGFDIYQVVKEAPAGIYRIEVQGFYRYGRTAYANYLNQDVEYVQPGGAPVFVYMNSKATPFTNVYGDEKQIDDATFYSSNSTDYSSETGADGTTLYFPNGMASAAIAFQDGMYKQSAYGIIKKGQDMRIGVKGVSNQLGDSWCIWDNFKLFNCGESADAVMMVLPDELENAKKLFENVMGKTAYGQLETAINNAQTALNNNDEKMFDALSDLFDAEEAANASADKFAVLNAANEGLMDKISSSKADNGTKDEARSLANSISSGIEGRTIEDAEVEGLLSQIKLLKNKLGIPAGYENATDAAPADFTAAIENPEYDEGTEGWEGTTAQRNSDVLNAEIFGQNYDYYQDIKGLPAGTYEVSVKAFYRAGGFALDYETYIANPEENNNAFLYAAYINGTDTIYNSTPLIRLAAEASSELEVGSATDGYVYAKAATSEEAGDGWIVPNTMTTAGYEFEAGKYANNKTIVKLDTDNATLRIGLMKNINITDNWTIFDGWTLTYYGKNSAKSASGDANAIVDITSQVAKVEFFNLNGARVNKPGKGVVLMKRTLSDGTVKVQKVTVK